MLSTEIQVALQTNTPAMLWGPPGVGKTHTTKKVAEKLGWHCEAVIASLHEPTSFSGYPYLKNDTVTISEPWLVSVTEKHKNVVLFLDELPTAPRSTQNVLLRLIHERRVGDYKLHDGVRIIAAGNFVDVAGNIVLSTAMANRFMHIFHKPSIGEWVDADSETDFPIINGTENWKSLTKQYKSVIYAFVEKYPTYFSQYPEAITKPEDYAFPTARSLSGCADIMAFCSSDLDLSRKMVSGVIGHEAAKKLIEFSKLLDTSMSFKNIDLKNFEFPKDESQVMILVKAAAMYADQKEFGEKSIKLFQLAYDKSYKPLAMKNVQLLASNLLKHMQAPEIVKSLPWVAKVLCH